MTQDEVWSEFRAACARLADRDDIEGRLWVVWCVTFMEDERQDVALRHLEREYPDVEIPARASSCAKFHEWCRWLGEVSRTLREVLSDYEGIREQVPKRCWPALARARFVPERAAARWCVLWAQQEWEKGNDYMCMGLTGGSDGVNLSQNLDVGSFRRVEFYPGSWAPGFANILLDGHEESQSKATHSVESALDLGPCHLEPYREILGERAVTSEMSP